ncbi:MAG: phosphoglycerate kinase, partial [Bacteroidia bacterium]|nr:phosphoglycerate kinase [Bacteroidia bacterium]
VYVNDAFGTAHRAHASTTVVAKFFPTKKLFGYLIENELTSIDKILQNPQGPKVAIMGGAKVSDKILIIENLLDKVNTLIIGGGMAYTFLRAMGKKTGNSICEEDKLIVAQNIIDIATKKGVKILLPVDVVLADKFENDATTKIVSVNQIADGWMGLDIGPETILNYSSEILNAKSILWNGPMGVFEMSNFETGTKSIALAIAEATQKGSFSLVGGGDSVAAASKYNITKKVSYVSTGGGALLEYMEGKTLPGIKAIKD